MGKIMMNQFMVKLNCKAAIMMPKAKVDDTLV